jgi:hypothetical protein
LIGRNELMQRTTAHVGLLFDQQMLAAILGHETARFAT